MKKLGKIGAFLLMSFAYWIWSGIILGTTYSYPTWFMFLEGIFFGSVFNFHELKLAPLYHGLNNEIFYFQYLNYNNLQD
jgi:hypothetical protein